ncbi:MAG TPA: thioredoxin family protein [Dehalococcoidia bacterium]|nr:thioredoxin family protein [Dehalococcoidia bacterium]
MAQERSVVTPDRFEQGLPYWDWLAQIKVNRDQFQRWYEACPISSEEAELFRRLAQRPEGPARVLALAEDWCPDVYRGLPVMARIAEAAGMELRVFWRDRNLDIMGEFLKDGQFHSIPTFVFYTQEHRYLCHWTERPALANRERAEIEEQVQRALAGRDDQEVKAEAGRRTRERYPVWQRATVQELKELLAGLQGDTP